MRHSVGIPFFYVYAAGYINSGNKIAICEIMDFLNSVVAKYFFGSYILFIHRMICFNNFEKEM